MCRDKNETVSHIVSGCSKLAHKEYKKRHDNVAKTIHWDLAGKCGFHRNDKRYNHVPDSVLENKNYKIPWDFSIWTEHNIEARGSDLVLADKSKKSCHIIDVAIPEDSGAKEKEAKKVEKYQNLARELSRMWEGKTKVVPIVLGGSRNSAIAIEGQLKGHRSRHINYFNPEAIAGISKDTKKSIRNVKKKKKKTGKRNILVFLGNLLLSDTTIFTSC